MRALFVLFLTLFAQTVGAGDLVDSVARHLASRQPVAAPASSIEVAFSPSLGAEDLVLKLIGRATKSIHVAAYSFTSSSIAKALVEASRKGVDVRIVADKSQMNEKYTAVTFAANMGVPTRINANYAAFHNKFIIVDQKHVGTGSFNFTASAARRNAENFLVVWDNAMLASGYAERWAAYWNESADHHAKY